MLFQLDGGMPIWRIETQLVGDGAGWASTMTQDGRVIAGVRFLATRVGRWWLQVRVTDVCGRWDTTGVQRTVIVR